MLLLCHKDIDINPTVSYLDSRAIGSWDSCCILVCKASSYNRQGGHANTFVERSNVKQGNLGSRESVTVEGIAKVHGPLSLPLSLSPLPSLLCQM